MRDRRARLVAFIDGWDCRPEYRITIAGRRHGAASLSDDALEDLAEEIRSGFWRERKHTRYNRAVFAAQLAGGPLPDPAAYGFRLRTFHAREGM